jgi:hypothetical protein
VVSWPSIAATPPSTVYPPDGHAKWYPRLEFPHATTQTQARGRALVIIELRGWLSNVGSTCNAETDWHYDLELDPAWLAQLGISAGAFVRPGDLLISAADDPYSARRRSGVVGVHIELDAWPRDTPDHRDARGWQPKPGDWTVRLQTCQQERRDLSAAQEALRAARDALSHASPAEKPAAVREVRNAQQGVDAALDTLAACRRQHGDSPCSEDVIWPFDPRLDAHGQPLAVPHDANGRPLRGPRYVRVVGSLVTDEPHSVTGNTATEIILRSGVDAGHAFLIASEEPFGQDTKAKRDKWHDRANDAAKWIWAESRGEEDPDDPARWTEIHSPDYFEILDSDEDPKERTRSLYQVAVCAQNGLVTGDVEHFVVDLAGPPHWREAGFELNWRAYPTRWTLGPSVTAGPTVTIADHHITVDVAVQGEAGMGHSGRFCTVYELWWSPPGGHLWHTLRHQDGSWEPRGDLQAAQNIPGPVRAVAAAAGAAGEVQFAYA